MKKTNFNIVGSKKIFFTISCVLIAVIVICTAVFGVDVAIEFKGGTLIRYSYTGELDLNTVQKEVNDILQLNTNVRQGEDFVSGQKTIEVSLVNDEGLTADKQFELTNKLQELYSDNSLELVNSSDVNPSSGRDFFNKCLVAVTFAAAVLIIYIAIRFRIIGGWSAGAMAVVALIHDVIIVFGTFVIFRIPIDANFMAVILTILGYSINDTIVIYDRIRENRKLYGKKKPIDELVNLSINQSFTRSIHTSISTGAAMIVVSVVAVICNVQSILSFSFPLIIGIISGTYSTICIAGPLWVCWENSKLKKKLSEKNK